MNVHREKLEQKTITPNINSGLIKQIIKIDPAFLSWIDVLREWIHPIEQIALNFHFFQVVFNALDAFPHFPFLLIHFHINNELNFALSIILVWYIEVETF